MACVTVTFKFSAGDKVTIRGVHTTVRLAAVDPRNPVAPVPQYVVDWIERGEPSSRWVDEKWLEAAP